MGAGSTAASDGLCRERSVNRFNLEVRDGTGGGGEFVGGCGVVWCGMAFNSNERGKKTLNQKNKKTKQTSKKKTNGTLPPPLPSLLRLERDRGQCPKDKGTQQVSTPPPPSPAPTSSSPPLSPPLLLSSPQHRSSSIHLLCLQRLRFGQRTVQLHTRLIQLGGGNALEKCDVETPLRQRVLHLPHELQPAPANKQKKTNTQAQQKQNALMYQLWRIRRKKKKTKTTHHLLF